jgi:hypothetical protein
MVPGALRRQHEGMRTAAIVLALATTLLATSRDARADEPAPTHLASYADDVLVTDIGGTLLVVVGGLALFDAPKLAVPTLLVGGALYLVGGPVVHARHQHLGRAFISLATRAALPILSAEYLGRPCESCAHDPLGGMGLVGAVGAAAGIAMLIDWAALSWERRPDVLPTVTPAPGGATLALAGRF